MLPLWPQYTGKGIKVGVIDDGVDSHKDLPTVTGLAPKAIDDNHGTSVAGIIAGKRNNLGTVGVAYKAASIGSFGNSTTVVTSSLQSQVDFDVSNSKSILPPARRSKTPSPRAAEG